VFQGNVGGQLVAYDATNGAKLWSFDAQTGVVAAPATYALGHEQYIVVLAGWGGTYAISAGDASRKGGPAINRSRVLAFKLGGTAKLPEATPPAPPAQPIPNIADAKIAAQGQALFHTHCSVCHGDSAVAGGVLPDLRWSPLNRSDRAWQDVVIGGVRKDRGMVSFAPVLSEQEAEAIRAYVVRKANMDYAASVPSRAE
jgi:mono/diheme cytochrome c family protein